VIVNNLYHPAFPKIPHNDIAIAPCAGKIVAVDAYTQYAPFVDAFNCADDGSGGKVPFFDRTVL